MWKAMGKQEIHTSSWFKNIKEGEYLGDQDTERR
jgi:hypothetical protein